MTDVSIADDVVVAGLSTPSTELTPPDHTYLYMDTPSRPMHWAMVLELGEGAALSLDAIRERVRERAARYELFRMGIREGRWRAPEVVIADQIDVAQHVTAAVYDDDRDLERKISELLGTHLPRVQPFWQITLFSPNAESRSGSGQFVLLRVHHSISDGIAGAAFAALLADGSPDELAEFDRFATSPRFRVAEVEATALKDAKASFNAQHAAAKTGRGWPRLTKSGRREHALYSESTRTLRRTAKKYGASVQELIVAAIGAAVSSLPPSTAKAVTENIRVTLPVTLDPEFRHTGNAVSVSLLNLPGNQPDLTAQINCAHEQLTLIAQTRPELALAAADNLPRMPWPIQRAIVNASMAHMSPDIHIGVNPGFSRVRSVLGADIAGLTALSPLAGYSFSVTALILGTRTTFGIVTDAQALPGYATDFVSRFQQVLADAADGME